MDLGRLLLLVVVQVGLLVFAFRDLLKPERRVRGGNKLLWGPIIVAVNLVGPLLYFLEGREEE